MFKKFSMAIVAVALISTCSFANDVLDDVANLDSSKITDASASIDGVNLDGLDVDALASNAGSEKSNDAIEACFRSFGYCGHYRPCYSYNYCYRPCYNYCYRPCYYTYCYRPVHYTCYTYSYPVYHSYWGCY